MLRSYIFEETLYKVICEHELWKQAFTNAKQSFTMQDELVVRHTGHGTTPIG